MDVLALPPPVLLLLASPRAPNCHLQLMASGPSVTLLVRPFAFILPGEGVLSRQK